MPLHSVYKDRDLRSPCIILKVTTKAGKAFAFNTHGRECWQWVHDFRKSAPQRRRKKEHKGKRPSQMKEETRGNGVEWCIISPKWAHILAVCHSRTSPNCGHHSHVNTKLLIAEVRLAVATLFPGKKETSKGEPQFQAKQPKWQKLSTAHFASPPRLFNDYVGSLHTIFAAWLFLAMFIWLVSGGIMEHMYHPRELRPLPHLQNALTLLH